MELTENAGDVVLHRLLADEEALADRLVRFASRQQLEDLLLARCQLGELFAVAQLGALALEFAQHASGDVGRENRPAVAERIGRLYDEILADEACHVGCIMTQLGPAGLRVMRALYHLIGPRLAQMPEITMLFDRADLARRFASFDVDATAAELGDKAYAFARCNFPVAAGASPAPAAKPPSL